MRIKHGLIARFLLVFTAWCIAGDSAVVGLWTGESTCTVPNSPCHDEHALYRISTDKSDPAKVAIDAYKVVDGKPEFMGTIGCDYDAAAGKLTCTANSPRKDEWEFHVSGSALTGT